MSIRLPLIDGHVHSLYSEDSSSKIEEIVERASVAGLKEVALTDHCFLPRHVTALRSRVKLASTNGLELLLGAEISIESDIGLKILAHRDLGGWDFVCGAVHGFPEFDLYPDFGDDCSPTGAFSGRVEQLGIETLIKSYVEMSILAMRTGYLDLLAHPFDLFCFAGMLPDSLFDAAERLVGAASQYSTCIELNNFTLNPGNIYRSSDELRRRRYNLYKYLVELCVKADVGLIPGSDAHCPNKVGDMSYVLEFCEEAGVKENALVRTLPRA